MDNAVIMKEKTDTGWKQRHNSDAEMNDPFRQIIWHEYIMLQFADISNDDRG